MEPVKPYVIPLDGLVGNLAKWATIQASGVIPSRLESTLITFHRQVKPLCKSLWIDHSFNFLEFHEQRHLEAWLLSQFSRISEIQRWAKPKGGLSRGEGMDLETLARNIAYSSIHEAIAVESE